jgi:hypothetical protein
MPQAAVAVPYLSCIAQVIRAVKHTFGLGSVSLTPQKGRRNRELVEQGLAEEERAGRFLGMAVWTLA